MTNYQDVPKTRDTLVSLATRLEYNIDKAKRKPHSYPLNREDKKPRTEKSTRKDAPAKRGGEASSSYDKYRKRDVADVTCYACHKKGHFATTCPDKDKPRNVKKVSIKEAAKDGTKEKEKGKDKVPQ